jgi:thymidylate synthase
MNNFEKQYSELINYVCEKGQHISSRNSKVRKVTGAQLRADLSEGLPIVTGKKIFPKSSFIETQWLLEGRTNVKWLNERGVKIWDQWADKNGDLGPVYGKQLLDFNGVNQIKNLIKQIKQDRFSRRNLYMMWNPKDVDNMQLPPCHYSFQLVGYKDKLDIVVSMRSLDLFIGLPYDMLMYSIILSAICKEVNLKPGEVIINAADCHIYESHVSSASIYANRLKDKLPVLKEVSTFTNFDYNKIKIENYNPQSRLEVKVYK